MFALGSKPAKISFAFYTGLGNLEPMINQITALWTGRFMHCEIVFPQNHGQHLACGVWQDETVFLRSKTFGKDCWQWQSISVTQQQYDSVLAFCRRQAQLKIPFNKWGLIRCTTPFPKPSDGKSWFCSELCVAALQQIGMFMDAYPSAMTPTMLHDALSKKTYTDASPLMEQRIRDKSLKFTRLGSRSGPSTTFTKFNL